MMRDLIDALPSLAAIGSLTAIALASAATTPALTMVASIAIGAIAFVRVL